MTTKKTAASYSPEVREPAVRLVLEGGRRALHAVAAMNSVAAKWVQQAESDGDRRHGTTTAERERVKVLEREVRELR